MKYIGRVKKKFTKTHETSGCSYQQQLEHCDSFYINTSRDNLNKMQKLHDSAAESITSRQSKKFTAEAPPQLRLLDCRNKNHFQSITYCAHDSD